ncbi:MAG: RsmB/NOP family class I SAM-dependent RNA methyltransferase [Candidatus Micrarchaeota archaeon]|nr:RsmB/NOP family class I SAM-dependent RNA methyltransferase [Candidatus Micrarchaeota archaeon]
MHSFSIAVATSIRINSLRISKGEFEDVMSKYGISPVGWYGEAYISEYENLSKTLEYQLGYFYIQSLSSMIPPLVLGPKEDDIILDMAAAPGSKSTQCAMHMNDKGVVVANDVSYMRLKSLASHIDRLGITCIAMTNFDGRQFPSVSSFNKVLLDAPCSSMGSRRCKVQHSEGRVRSLARLQKALLLRAFDLLCPGGTLVYSTCTTTVHENEEVVESLLQKRENAYIEKPALPFSFGPGISGNDTLDSKVCRFTLDESFFIAKIRKR